MNNYEVAEIVEIGRAQDVILGSNKFEPIYDDGPGLPLRNQLEQQEDE
jgi:hypothetical protein